MSDFAISWELARQRFVDAVSPLNQEQLNWKMQPDALTAGQMAVHVAGVEVSFSSQLCDTQLDELGTKLKSAATDGVVNDKPFPFRAEEITPEFVGQSLSIAKAMTEPIMRNPSQELKSKQIQSALGPIITGEGALARLAFHPAYHQGQVHILVTSPDFPK